MNRVSPKSNGKSSFIVALMLALFLGTLPTLAGDHSVLESVAFSTNVLVNTPTEGDQLVPDVAIASNGTVYSVWMDTRFDEGDIYLASSTDGGSAFGASIKVNDDVGVSKQGFPSIVVDSNGVLYVVWEDWRNDLDGRYVSDGGVDGENKADIYLSRSVDGGLSWQANARVDNNSGGLYQYSPKVAVDSNHKVHVVYAGPQFGGASKVYYSNSSDGGTLFDQSRCLSNESYSARHPDFSISETGNVTIAWGDSRYSRSVYGVRSTDYGGSFGSEIRINDTDIGGRDPHPSVSSRGDIVVVAWESSDGLRTRTSSDGGVTFGPSVVASDPAAWVEILPSISISPDSRIFLCWTDKRTGDEDILLSISADRGMTYSGSQRVNDDSTLQHQRRCSVQASNSNGVYLVWQDERSGTDWDIYFATSTLLLPDLTLSSSDIDFDPLSPVLYGTEVLINATAHNVGEENTTDILVRFYDTIISPLNLINETTIPLIQKGGQSWAVSRWTATTPQFHDICIVLDPDNSVMESNEANNTACKQLEVILPPIPAQPGNLTARLTGGESSNVTLGWSLSPDDGGSVNVTRYDIYRNGSFDAGGREYVVIGWVPNATSSYVDEGAGEGDPSIHFYYVCAIGDMNISSCTDNQAAKFTRPLAPGPNLVSIPLIQSDESIETVLQTVQYDKAWHYGSSSQEWKWFMKHKRYRRGLFEVNHTTGLWIDVTEDSNLTVAGIVPAQTTIHLHQGWNLVSFPSFNSSYTVYDLKMDTGAVRVEGCDPSPPYHLSVLEDAEVLLAGEAFWVRVTADNTWTVDIV